MSMRFHFQAWGDLAARYGGAFRRAWTRRAELDPVPRRSHEAQFLPAALALQETPLSPAPRVAMRLLVGFAVLAVLWASFGWIDVVATAHGKIVPNDRVKTIQPMETATVKAIRVTDGQHVKVGEVLVELDATVADADIERIGNDLREARLLAARDTAFLRAMQGGKAVLLPPADVPSARVRDEQRLLDSEWLEFRTKQERLDADRASRQAGLRGTQATLDKLAGTVPLARQRAEDYRSLLAKNFISKHGYMEREQTRIEQEGALAEQSEKFREQQAALLEAEKQKAELVASTRRTVLDRLHDSEQKIAAFTQDIVKARQRGQLLRLAAPVEGVVQQLAVHTVGGVVTPAQPLLVIVPGDQTLEIEAFVENKDIGFVNAGQDAEVKVETFPYTRYGTLQGRVTQVSTDAVDDEKRGLIYSTRIQLQRATMRVEHKTVNLSPGMAVTVEVKTGKRRVIEYFLSPLMQYAGESLHER